MISVKTYEQIISELTYRRSEATSNSLRNKLDSAIEDTKQSRKCLEILIRQHEVLLADLSPKPPIQSEIIQTAAANIIANEAIKAKLQEELSLTLKSKESTRAAHERPIPKDLSPETRKLLKELKDIMKKAEKTLRRDPDEIRQDILRIQQMNQHVIEAASTAIQLASESQSMLKAIYAASNLWLTHILVNKIYDTKNVEFEVTVRSEQRAEGLSWIFGQILGFVPFVGISISILELIKDLADVRDSRWKNTDTTLAFLEKYEEALRAWGQQCKEFSTRVATFLATPVS